MVDRALDIPLDIRTTPERLRPSDGGVSAAPRVYGRTLLDAPIDMAYL
jgi:hypothetical protein